MRWLFFGHFWPLSKPVKNFQAPGAVAKIGLSLNSNYQIKFSFPLSLIHTVSSENEFSRPYHKFNLFLKFDLFFSSTFSYGRPSQVRPFLMISRLNKEVADVAAHTKQETALFILHLFFHFTFFSINFKYFFLVFLHHLII